MKIAFIHPDLGIGGAERLVVDAALGLQNKGHEVTIYTSHCDRNHCFEEVKSNKLKVQVRGDSVIPRSIGGKLYILCAILRQLFLVFSLIVSGELFSFDAFFIDQLSTCIPIIRVFSRGRVLFYCHFPDQLLAEHSGYLRRAYRLPFDVIEQWTTGCADKIAVNSKFTLSVFRSTFRFLSRTVPVVVYPCVNSGAEEQSEDSSEVSEAVKNVERSFGDAKLLLSVNRFERKKTVELAIKSFALLCGKHQKSKQKPKLVVAGGFDQNVAENIEYLAELQKVCREHQLTSQVVTGNLPNTLEHVDVVFMPSISSAMRTALLRRALLLLYTPSREHFGIVPLESMLERTPVLAVNSGGPVETVKERKTGFLRPSDENEWFSVLDHVCYGLSTEQLKQMGDEGRKFVLGNFSQDKMAAELEKIYTELLQKRRVPFPGQAMFASVLMLVFLLGVSLPVILVRKLIE